MSLALLVLDATARPDLDLDPESGCWIWTAGWVWNTGPGPSWSLSPACIQVLDVVPDPILNVVLVPGVDLAAELSPNPGPPCSTVQD